MGPEERSGDRAEERQWNYFNVLELLLAYLPEARYTADSGRWSMAVRGLRDRHEASHPELFNRIHFLDREPMNPVGIEVNEFLKWLQVAGGAGVWNPSYGVLELRGDILRRMRERNEPLLTAYLDAIRKMADEIADDLRVENPGDARSVSVSSS